MKTTVLVAVAVAAVLPVATAEASNRSVARERMTAQLFAEYNGPETVGFEYDGYRDGYERQLMMKVDEGHGSIRWVPVELRVSCHRNSCTGLIWEEESKTWVLGTAPPSAAGRAPTTKRGGDRRRDDLRQRVGHTRDGRQAAAARLTTLACW